MKENENKKPVILLNEARHNKMGDSPGDNGKSRAERLKKPTIFLLMAIVFIGCMYLIFKPSGEKAIQDMGLNGMVPQASDTGIPADKQKAYELASLEQAEQEKKNDLLSLSDYWNTDDVEADDSLGEEESYAEGTAKSLARGKGNAALTSYRTAQNTLSSFYQNDNSQTEALRREVETLQQRLREKDEPDQTAQQLALMEKSYQMASRYLPTNSAGGTAEIKQQQAEDSSRQNIRQNKGVIAFTPERKKIVSALYREPSDSAFVASIANGANGGFNTVGAAIPVSRQKNSIRACIQETQTISGEGSVKIRLLEAARMPGHSVPVGSVLTAHAKFAGGRLQLTINSIEAEGNIIPVEISIYDLDGQLGLNVPRSPEMNALSDIAANMGQSTGTSIMMTQNAGQQVAGELSKGLIQGVTSYFSKKMQTPKVTLKAGHQLFLVAKK